jgi:hypothetical protein
LLDHGRPYDSQPRFPEDRNNMIPEMPFVRINGSRLMKT